MFQGVPEMGLPFIFPLYTMLENLKIMREQVIKNTTLDVLNEYLYIINIFQDEVNSLRKLCNEKSQEYDKLFNQRVKELIETPDEKWKFMSKTAAETHAMLEHNPLLQEVKGLKRDLENAEADLKLVIINYHHWKSVLKGEFNMDVQVNDFANIPDSDNPF